MKSSSNPFLNNDNPGAASKHDHTNGLLDEIGKSVDGDVFLPYSP